MNHIISDSQYLIPTHIEPYDVYHADQVLSTWGNNGGKSDSTITPEYCIDLTPDTYRNDSKIV